MRFVLKLCLTAGVFLWVLPFIHGISFHGNFLIAVAMAVLFGIMLWVVDIVAVGLSALMTVSSLGVALLWLIPLWLFGFWLLPAVALKLVSDFFPYYLSISGWIPAALGGLVMLLIGVLTSGLTEQTLPTFINQHQ